MPRRSCRQSQAVTHLEASRLFFSRLCIPLLGLLGAGAVVSMGAVLAAFVADLVVLEAGLQCSHLLQ